MIDYCDGIVHFILTLTIYMVYFILILTIYSTLHTNSNYLYGSQHSKGYCDGIVHFMLTLTIYMVHSIVKDTLGGLLRSQIVCPDCGKSSVKFDYFSTLMLAIPQRTTVTVKIIFVPQITARSEADKLPELYSFEIDRAVPFSNIVQMFVKQVNTRQRKNQRNISFDNLFLLELGWFQLQYFLCYNFDINMMSFFLLLLIDFYGDSGGPTGSTIVSPLNNKLHLTAAVMSTCAGIIAYEVNKTAAAAEECTNIFIYQRVLDEENEVKS